MVEDQTEISPIPEGPGRCGTRDLPRFGAKVDFERLYQMHSRRVYRLCWNMVWNKVDAEDLMQEVFLQVFRKIDTYRGEAAFTTWLHRVAVNVALMRLRKKSRLAPSLGESSQAGDQPNHGREELADPNTPLAGALERLDLERAMAQLPPGFRHAVLLHDVEGYGHAEIARMLGTTEGTSKSQLHKARLRLRDLLGETARGPWTAQGGGRLPHPAPGQFRQRRVSRRRLLVLTPRGGSLRRTPLPGPHRADPETPGALGAVSQADRFEPEEVSYGKVQCA